MKKLATFIVLFMSIFLLAAWGSDSPLPQREQKILAFFRKLETGTNPDYGLVKVGVTGVANPTIIVYGYLANQDVCQEIAAYFKPSTKSEYQGCLFIKH